MASFRAYKSFNYNGVPTATLMQDTAITSTSFTRSGTAGDGTGLVYKLTGSGFVDSNKDGLIDTGTLSSVSLLTNTTMLFILSGLSSSAQPVNSYSVDGVTLSGTAATLALWLSGNDSLTGSDAADTLAGFAGNDSISGGLEADRLEGWSGNDTLNGGTGNDSMLGGIGDDLYLVDATGDQTVETVSSGGGLDTVSASVSYSLGNYLENLILTGSQAVSGTGNSLANTITGSNLANILDGGAGADTLIGGLGNDTYYVNTSLDVVQESSDATYGGNDTLISMVSQVLGNYLENLTLDGTANLYGTGNALNNRITGNAGSNTLDGKAGADTLIGGAGNDTYYVDSSDTVTELADSGTDSLFADHTRTLSTNTENLTLTGTASINGTGNALANRLAGNDGNNILDGKAGADSMAGGLGNDTYYVDNTGDRISESSDAVAGGVDIVYASATCVLSTYVEKLVLTGSGAINATGNTLNNHITGNAGANVISGGAGNDTLVGGAGNDSYMVDSSSDVVTELDGGGIDTVFSNVTRTLGSFQEHLTLNGGAAINGTGNELANKLTGNSLDNVLTGLLGNDTLNGAAGNDRLTGSDGIDVLTGGSGNDVFDFNSASEIGVSSGARDTITDFTSGLDRIDLTGMDANSATATTNEAFTLLLAAGNTFTAAGQLRIESGVLYGNTDTDADAEFAISLTGVTSLSLSDILL